MSEAITVFFSLQGYFPNIYLFVMTGLKTTSIVLVGWGAASFLKSRSAAARCWAWRCTLLGVMGLLAFDHVPGAISKIRLGVHTRPLTVEEYKSAVRKAGVFGLLRSQHNFNEVVEEKRNSLPTVAAPPWKDEATPITISDQRAPSWNLIETWLPRIWWSVACVLILFTAFRIVSGMMWLRLQDSEWDNAMSPLAEGVARSLAIKARPEINIVSKIHSPLVLGILRPVIYFPPGAYSWSENKLRAVYLHELSHWKRGDIPWRYFSRVASCLFWWNPLVALAARQMDAEAEEAADDAVLLHQHEAGEYATALVEIAAADGNQRMPASGIPMVGCHPLERRIKALLADNPWRGRVGSLATALIVILLLASVSGASIYVARVEITGDGTAIPSKLTPEQRVILERIADANIRRINSLRFVHFKLESTETDETNGASVTSPKPTKLEAWVDEWTGIRRLEFRPQVLRWTNGATPFSIDDSTEIYDGKLQKTGRFGMQSYLGFYELNELIRITKQILGKYWPPDNECRYVVDNVMRDGKSCIRIREQFLNKKGGIFQQRTFLVDPSQDEQLVFCELAFPSPEPKGEPTQWILKKTGIAENGALYPEIVDSVFSFNAEKTAREEKVTFLEALTSLPSGITDVPP